MWVDGNRLVICQNKAANTGNDNLPAGLCMKNELTQQVAAVGD